MPELPELEVLRNNLGPKIIGKPIVGVQVRSPAVLKTHSPDIGELINKRIVGIERRGKHLVFVTDSFLFIVVHLMRSGRLEFCSTEKAVSRSISLRIKFNTGQDLRFVEPVTKKMMAIYVVPDLSVIPRLNRTGIEPLSADFTPERLSGLVHTNKIQLKKFLTDQRLIAGIGNAYADEILYYAKLSPLKITTKLTGNEVRVLASAIPAVLRSAIEKIKERVGGGLFQKEHREFLVVHGRAGQPCPVCGTTIREIRYRDHSTFYCPGCQTGGRILADRRFSKFLK